LPRLPKEPDRKGINNMAFKQFMPNRDIHSKFGAKIHELKGGRLFYHPGPKVKMIAAIRYSMKKSNKEYEVEECMNKGFVIRIYKDQTIQEERRGE